jgi:type II secretory ATPase GspE/PulE/Tfp pilus assembly ATPase PilB-like protein
MSTPAPGQAPKVDSEILLNKILMQLHDGADLQRAIGLAYPDIMALMDAERVTIYQKDKISGDVVSRFKVADELKEIRVSCSTTSLSGYCALTRQVINVADVYDAPALSKIHPALVFQDSFDRASGFRTRAMMVLPILFHDALLGVLQVINRRSGDAFNNRDVGVASKLATILAQKLRYELQATSGPYAHLVNNGRLKQSDLDDIKLRASKTRQTVTQLLMRELRISASEIGASMERHYQIPYMPFDPALVTPKELTQGIKESYLRACGWLPVAGDRKEVTILIDDPSDNAKLREIQSLINAQKYIFKLGLPEDMLRFLGQEVATPNEGESAGSASATSHTETSIGEGSEESDAAVVQLVNRLLMQAYLDRASDIHIEPSASPAPTGVRFRVDGSCLWKEDIPTQMHRAVISRIKILAKLDISEQRKPQDGKLMVRYKGNPLEFRIATIPTVHGESMVLRLLSSGAKLMKIDEMNIAPHYHGMLHKVLAQPHGVFLVVGPTGSGKTTSLHALLNHLNTADRKIWTAEDPVEITQKGLQQVQVHPKIGFTFAAAMRSFLRCDPDIIMVGEMRDQETATIGIEASLTGHLVFSTLHSNSAPETLTRLMDLGVEKSSFADALLGVMSQRLMRKLCSKCKQPVPLTPELKGDLKALYGERFEDDCGAYLGAGGTLFRHGKCNACQNTGFHGRVPIHEFLVASPDLKRLISQGARLEQLIDAACQAGMRTLIQDQVIKAFMGHVDVDEALGAI